MFSPVGQTSGTLFYRLQNEVKNNVTEVIEELCQTDLTLIDEDAKQASLLLFELVKVNFAVLNQNGNSPHMPEILQIIFVLLIIVEKEGNECSIFPEDIYNLLDRLELHLVGKDKAAIAVYRQNDVGSLVTRGIEFCRTKTEKNIVFVASGNFSTCQQNASDSFVAEGFDLCEVNQGTATAEFLALPELHLHLNSFLPFRDSLHLSQTCVLLNGNFWSSTLRQLSEEEQLKTEGMDDQDKFLKHPEFRRLHVADDKRGIAHLNSIGINSPLMIQKIRNGELSIEAALAVLKVRKENSEKFTAALANPNLTDEDKRKLGPVKKYIVDGSITIDRAIKITDRQQYFLFDRNIRLLIEHGALPIDRAINLSESEFFALSNQLIRQLIVYGALKIDQIFNASDEVRAKLAGRCYSIEKYIIDSSGILDCNITLPCYVTWNLSSSAVEEFIDNGLLTLDQAISLSEAAGNFLNNSGVQFCIKQKLLTVDQAIDLADDRRFSLFNTQIKKCIFAGSVTQNRIDEIDNTARWDLVAKGIQLCTADSSLTPKKIAQYYMAEKWDLLEEAIQQCSERR